ncbi:MAG: periplasmic heavy metal sensor [Rhodobacteraceae bacterium]|nr:periplasmic heavy metal sensor [Paracoccaceae bacterium]
MSEQTTPQVKGTPRWIKVALIVSVAVNLGIAGVIGGAVLRAPEIHRNNLEAPEGVAMLARAMPAAHQRELREDLRDRRGDLQPDREELRSLRDRFVVALRAEPFDLDAVNAVFADQRVMLSNLTAAGHDSVIEQIEKMSLRDREMYIRRLLGDDRAPPRQ